MKLSMWILADWLKRYNPFNEIKSGPSVLKGVRLYTSNMHELDKDIVYIARTIDIFPNYNDEHSIVCVNMEDRIIVNHVDINDVLNEVVQAFEFYFEWDASLMEAVYNKESYQKMVDLSYPIFKNPIFVLDWRGKILGLTKEYSPIHIKETWDYMVSNKNLPPNVYGKLKLLPTQLATIEKNQEEAFIVDYYPYTHKCIHCSVSYKKEAYIIFNVIESNTPLSTGMKQLANNLKKAFLILHQYMDIPIDVRPGSFLFSQILTGAPIDEKALEWVLATLGWDQTKNWYLVAFSSIYPDMLSHKAFLEMLENHIDKGFSFSLESKLLMIIDCKNWPQILPKLKKLLADSNFRCGVSLPFSDWNDISSYLKQAETAIDFGESTDVVNMCAHYAWRYILNDIAITSRNKKMLHPAVNILEAYDKKNGSEFYRTLYEYLKNERNATNTANALFIHRNSLQYRLNRIYELIDADLNEASVRMHIMLSYYTKTLGDVAKKTN